MLKSFIGHFDYVENLVASINRFNCDDIRTYIVVPKNDMKFFQKFASPNIFIIEEELIPTKYATNFVSGIRPEYINQEIVKLAFGRLGLAKSYMCLDSDGIFLKNFYLSDFLTSSGEPYAVLVEDKELQLDTDYYENFWISRKESLDKILDYLGLSKDEIWLTCHNFQIFSSDILSQMQLDLLDPGNLDFIDLLEISPYEYSWYNYYLQSLNKVIRIREPYFKIVHTSSQLLQMRMLKQTVTDIARGYVGLCVQSGMLGDFGPITIEENTSITFARFLTFQNLMSVLIHKLVLLYRYPKITLAHELENHTLGKILLIFISKLRDKTSRDKK